MKYYFSGSEAMTGELRERVIAACPTRLQSCHGSYIKQAYDWLRDTAIICPGQQEILLDSGAFTAWSKGEEVSLDHLIAVYSDIIDKYGPVVKKIWLINLDKIPGRKGRDPTPEEITEALRISDENFEKLCARFGGCVLPVFHQGESLARLNEVHKMAEYICVSPRNDLVEKSRVEWSRLVHQNLPIGKMTHGLATTGKQMTETVPWFSVDSATWVISGGLGQITPLINGKLYSISISQESPNRYDMDKHYDSLTDIHRAAVDSRLASYDFTAEQARQEHAVRKAFNFFEILEWLKILKVQHYQQGTLFDI